MPHLEVERHGHFNQFAERFARADEFLTDVLGGQHFLSMIFPYANVRSYVTSVGLAAIELFGILDDSSADHLKSLSPPYTGWHSMEWTVPSLDIAKSALTEHDVRVAFDRSPGVIWTEREDLHGLCLELTPHHFERDPRELPSYPDVLVDKVGVGYGGGRPGALIACRNAAAAVAKVSALTGMTPDPEVHAHPELAATGHVVYFDDHYVEFLSADGAGPVAEFVEDHGENMFALSLPVLDYDQASAKFDGLINREWTRAASDRRVWLRADANQGAIYAFTAQDTSVTK